MSFRVRRILVAIRDERHALRGPLLKAAAIARASGARIELFHAINEPEALDALRRGLVTGHPAREIIDRITGRSNKRLARLAELKEFRGLKVTCNATWDFPPHEAIIRHALSSDADLVIASIQPKAVGGRLLLANTDWELIRHCPCPVLLVKSKRAWSKPAVVAAIDPFHAHDKPAALDRRILEAGKYLAQTLRGSLHAFHAYMPLVLIGPASASGAMAVVVPAEMEDIHSEQVRQGFDRAVAAFGVTAARRHLEMGTVLDELAQVVNSTRAGIVVTGAVSRSALKRFFIGNTAERTLDRLECDLLIVKPREFRSRVPRRVSTSWLKG